MKELNRQQYVASRDTGGVHLVLAGAGTGKTKTLVEKVCSVLTYGGAIPEEILIMTFSRKAAGEIRERIVQSVGEVARKIDSGTFHSFCLSFLKEHPGLLIKAGGYRDFPRVLDDDKKEEMIEGIIKKNLQSFLGLPVNVIRYLLERRGQIPREREELLEKYGVLREIEKVEDAFQKEKRRLNYIEFEDMIFYTNKILSEQTTVRERLSKKYRYIFVDEFQDTSDNNFELVKLLLPDNRKNLFAVGDDFQSIYGFRNARVSYIIDFEKYCPEATIHTLKINYRSRGKIVKLSNRFIKHNRNRTRKRLYSFKGRGGTVKDFCVEGFVDEVDCIRKIIDEYREKSREITILCRNNWQVQMIMKAMHPYRELVDSGKLQCITMHSSKGLEFDTVIIAGVADSILPDTTSDIEEERRLMYVALTRAKEHLFIVHHSKGGKPARFARELGFSVNRY